MNDEQDKPRPDAAAAADGREAPLAAAGSAVADRPEAAAPAPAEELVAAAGAAPAADAAPAAAGEAAAAADGAVAAQAVERLAELERELAAERERASLQADLALRTQAEMDNLRKRSANEVDKARKFALEKFAGEIIGVRDSLEMGLAAAAQPEAEVASIREGTELTLKMLVAALEKFNIEQLDPAGQPFDPELHQAMGMQSSDEHPPNTVMMVVQKGYTLNGRLLRPAMVMVSKA